MSRAEEQVCGAAPDAECLAAATLLAANGHGRSRRMLQSLLRGLGISVSPAPPAPSPHSVQPEKPNKTVGFSVVRPHGGLRAAAQVARVTFWLREASRGSFGG